MKKPIGVVSVPLRGFSSESDGNSTGFAIRDYEFPSPCGEKIVMNVKAKLAKAHVIIVSVPLRGKDSHEHQSDHPFLNQVIVSVPLRGKDSHERNSTSQRSRYRLVVSVPLRGKDSHERFNGELQIHKATMQVSVPLRGKDSHERRPGKLGKSAGMSRFPSPCGEKIVMNTAQRRPSCTPRLQRFRPLAGKR